MPETTQDMPLQDAPAAEAMEQDTLDTQRSHGLNLDDQVSGSQGLDASDLSDDDSSEADDLRALLEEAKDKHLRLAAEFENFKRRTTKERMELFQTAGRDVIQSLLPALDDMERASKTLETAVDVTSVKEGLTLVFGKLKNILQSKGLKAMDSGGQPFDAELHEAITEVPAPTEALKGKVIDVVEAGYYLNDKLIRHAKVVVGN